MTYTILERRQTWRIVDGHWHREAVARRSDGQLRLILCPEVTRA